MNKITTKVYGVDMEAVQKLRQFRFLLKKRKLSQTFDKMGFLQNVQVKGEHIKIPIIKQIMVSDCNIHFVHEPHVIINKSTIYKLDTTHNNRVVLKFKTPIWLVGAFILFDFLNDEHKQQFLEAIGEIAEFSDDSDSSNEDTPPNSDDS